MSEQKTEEEKLTEYAGQALRGPKFGIFEQLICQHLVQATVSTNPLRKIQLIVEAAFMIEEEKQKKLQIDPEKLEVVRAITDAFTHRNEINNKEFKGLVELRFGFDETEENFKRYIAPWCKNGEKLTHFPTRVGRMNREYGETYQYYVCAKCHNEVTPEREKNTLSYKRCNHCGAVLESRSSIYSEQTVFVYLGFRLFKDTPAWRSIFIYSKGLSQSGYNKLKNEFLQWAIPYSMQLMRKLTTVVRPEIYNEIAKMFAKTKEGAESST